MLNFSEALTEMKMGNSVLRYSSDIEYKSISLIETEDSSGFYVTYYDDMKVPFTPTHFDMVSEDWYVVCSTS